MKRKKPKFIFSYHCWDCHFVTYLDDREKPRCGDCGNEENLLVTGREKYSQAAINRSMREVVERIIYTLEIELATGEYDFSAVKKPMIDQLDAAKKLHVVLSRKRVSKKEIDRYMKQLKG